MGTHSGNISHSGGISTSYKQPLYMTILLFAQISLKDDIIIIYFMATLQLTGS